MLTWVTRLGAYGIRFCRHFGQFWLFLARVVLGSVPVKDWLAQVMCVGTLSLTIIVISAAFIGAVLGLQGYYTLSQFDASDALGQMIALTVLRELGPVVTALLFAGRACSALTSEIGLMKATEQLVSMRMMGVDPIRRVIAPRFWAAAVSLPLLTLVFNAIAVVGGFCVGVLWLGVNSGAFWGNMQASVSFTDDVLNGIIKSIVFGVVISWVAVYQGYRCTPTAAGIARATTRTVVYASLLVLGLDFFLTAVMFK